MDWPWLPVHDIFEPKNGQRLVGGTVDEVSIKMSSIVLDENIELRGRSGSPLISQSTGKVIGTLSRGGTIDGKAYILIAPSAGILRGMRDAETMRVMPRLEEETRGR